MSFSARFCLKINNPFSKLNDPKESSILKQLDLWVNLKISMKEPWKIQLNKSFIFATPSFSETTIFNSLKMKFSIGKMYLPRFSSSLQHISIWYFCISRRYKLWDSTRWKNWNIKKILTCCPFNFENILERFRRQTFFVRFEPAYVCEIFKTVAPWSFKIGHMLVWIFFRRQKRWTTRNYYSAFAVLILH